MHNSIQTKYDEGIKGYIIDMPDLISLNSIQIWIDEFNTVLKTAPSGQLVNILINTNKHNFESIQCLKELREFFTSNSVIQTNGVKAAFVGPKHYIEPHQKSEFEAYFELSNEAYKWLQG